MIKKKNKLQHKNYLSFPYIIVHNYISRYEYVCNALVQQGMNFEKNTMVITPSSTHRFIAF